MESIFAGFLRSKPMTLIVSLPANDAALSRVAFAAGADAVKVHCNVMHRASGSGFGPLSQYQETFERILSEAQGPVGLVPGALIEDVQRDLRTALHLPFDFFSLYSHCAPAIVLDYREKLMLALGYGDGSAEARQLETLSVPMLEASIIAADGYGELLSARDLALYQDICQSTSVPVVVPTQRSIQPDDLRYLHEAGVKGLMIGAIVTGTKEDTIKRSVEAFRTAIDCGF